MDENAPASTPERNSQDLAHELDLAFEAGQFFLMYQPNIDLHTGAFAGVETLLRWRHPTRGVLAPDHFMVSLESSDLIVKIGRWTLNTASAKGASWHDMGYRFPVSINISSRQFASVDIVDDVTWALDSSRFDPALLVLEFSQATLLEDRDLTNARIGELKRLGIRVAVDDFIPGASSLTDVQTFGLDTVKLARSFVADMASSAEAVDLVHQLVDQCEAQHVQLIAAGVEDSEQRERLAKENVRLGQGFFFSVPHEADEIDRFLEDFAIFSGKPL